jgi:hypothetical protein
VSPVALRTPIADDGLWSVNFFNGRLLSAEDLKREQDTAREARRRLGLSIGAGIASGLDVSPAPSSTALAPVVRIEPGLVVNRLGDTLRLARQTEIALVRDLTVGATKGAGFGECQPPQSEVFLTGDGVYLLVLRPATRREGRAPVSGLGNIEASCNTRYTIESVMCHLIPVPLTAGDLANTRLRNQLAYRCFGADRDTSFVTEPLPPSSLPPTLLDDLRPNLLTDCDVPLALVHWTGQGLQFVDQWSVRRRIARPSGAPAWSSVLGDAELGMGEAMVLQFAEHVEKLREAAPQSVRAVDHFEYLPPVGVLPLAGTATRAGFSEQRFFDTLVTRGPAFIEGARLSGLVRAAIAFPPIDLTSRELIWLYRVRENQEAIDYTDPQTRPYLVFTSGHVPYHADARFNVGKWSYSNCALDR